MTNLVYYTISKVRIKDIMQNFRKFVIVWSLDILFLTSISEAWMYFVLKKNNTGQCCFSWTLTSGMYVIPPTL